MNLTKTIVAGSVAAMLCGCGGSILSRDERAQYCTLRVDASPAMAAAQHNTLRHPAGAAGGAAAGALVGAYYGLAFFPFGLVFAPAAMAALTLQGAGCSVASLTVPEGENDFAAAVTAADTRRLVQSLESTFNAPRPECATRQPRGDAGAADATVTIGRVTLTMGCLLDAQDYALTVDWKMVDARTGHRIAESKTRCEVTSALPGDKWGTDRDRARAEIEEVFDGAGRNIGLQLSSSERVAYACKLQAGVAATGPATATPPPPGAQAPAP